MASNFGFFAGNEDCIEEIVLKIREMLLSKGLIDAESHKPVARHADLLRKITFYLMLNTEVTLKHDLISDHNVSHLLKTVPQLSSCLLLAVVWSLSLDEFLCECIAYAPIWFSYAFIENSADSLKYSAPYETLGRVDRLIRSIYTNIARSDYRAMDPVERKVIFNRLYAVIMELLRNFFSPSEEKFENWTKNRQYMYMGYVVKQNLELILHCLNLFLNKPPARDSRIPRAFELMREREPLVEEHRREYSETTRETLHWLNTTLLNTLQSNVMQVDCNAFMYWVEVDLDEETTLQRSVGEAAHALCQLLNVNESFEHDVGDILKSIAIRPLTTEELIEQSSIGAMIEKLEKMGRDEPQLHAWIDGFVRRGELVLNNQECLETIEMHRRSLTVDNIRTMIEFAASVNRADGCVIEDKLIENVTSALGNFNENEILNLIQYSIELGGAPSDYLQSEDFDQMLVETFNKVTFSQDSRSYFELLLQNPKAFYDKVLEEALTTEKQMIEMVEVMRITARIYKLFFNDHLEQLIGEKCNASNRNFIAKLIAQLFTMHIDDPTEFIINKLYKKYLVQALQVKNINQILLIIESMLGIAHGYDFSGICPPILVMAAQVLELCRWNATTFSENAVTAVVKCQEFVHEIMKKFLPTASDEDRKWIKGKIGDYEPLTKFYFQKLSLTKEQPIQRFDEFLLQGKSADGQKAFKFLCEHLMRCTSKEVKWLSSNAELLQALWEALNTIALIFKRANDRTTGDCLRYCCNSVLAVVEVKSLRTPAQSEHHYLELFTFVLLQSTLAPSTATAAERADLAQKIIRLLKSLAEMPLYNDIFLNSHSIIVDLLRRLPEDGEDRAKSIEDAIASIDELPNCEARDLILSKLRNK